jgi:hypothetical protein
MNLHKLERKLIDAARLRAPVDHVPYAFEKRIRALLAGKRPLDLWALWGRALWKAAAPCLAISLLLGAWALFVPANSNGRGDITQDFENTLLAGADQDQPAELSE